MAWLIRLLKKLIRLFTGPDFLKRSTVTVGDRTVIVRELTSLEYQLINDNYADSARDGTTFDDIAFIVSIACENFEGMKPEKVRAKLSGMALGQINREILRLSGLINEDESNAKEIDQEATQKKSGI